jgi:putrescine carbamoyltransferase
MDIKHFIDTQDFSKSELLEIIQLIRLIKAADKQNCTPRLLTDVRLGHGSLLRLR